MSFTAATATPRVGTEWISSNNQLRLNKINTVLTGTSFVDFISPTRTFDDGQVYFSFNKQIASSIRGVLLLDLELLLKKEIDDGIVVWCEPIGDKNSLRNLRGIEIIT
jgi:hypothetical protein